jgi:hypothetical protein
MAQPGGYYAPPSPPKRSLGLILGVVAAAVVLVACAAAVLAAVVLSSHSQPEAAASSAVPSTDSTSPSTDSTAPTSGRSVIGQPVRQKDLEITVTGAPRCGAKSLGSGDYAAKTQKGQYCLVDLKFRNVGKTAVKPTDSDTALIDTLGGEYYVDFSSDQANPDGKLTLFDNIYPGKTATGVVAFDLPKGQTPKTLKLNPVGAFTDEIDIDLS